MKDVRHLNNQNNQNQFRVNNEPSHIQQNPYALLANNVDFQPALNVNNNNFMRQAPHTQFSSQMHQQNQIAITTSSQLPYIQQTHLQQFHPLATSQDCQTQTLTQQPLHQPHNTQPQNINLNQQHTTRAVSNPISQIKMQLYATQAHLNSMVPQLTMLQTQLETASQNHDQNTQQIKTHYTAVLSAYEQHYAQYSLYLQQIQQLQAFQPLHTPPQNLQLSGPIHRDNLNDTFDVFKTKEHSKYASTSLRHVKVSKKPLATRTSGPTKQNL
eukprot:877586_1